MRDAGTAAGLAALRGVARAVEPRLPQPQFLSFASFKDADGKWQRSRSIVLSLSMKSGLQVADFGNAVQAELSEVRRLLPKIYHHQHRSLPAVSDAVGRFGALHYSVPIVLTASLVASRLVSMTFIPLLGFHLLRPSKRQAPSIEERRNTGFAKHDYRVVSATIRHRFVVLAGAAARRRSWAWGCSRCGT